jgi:hypothetical protein
MTSYDMEFRCCVMKNLKAISNELRRANKLKALEIKSHAEESLRQAVEYTMKEDEQ